MSASIVRLTESTFHDILSFVVASSRLCERKSLYESLRQFGRGVLNLDEMVIGRCDGAPETIHPNRCSNFDPVVSLKDSPQDLPLAPCASAARANGCGAARAEASGSAAYDAEPGNGRVVVCHRRKLDEPSLCIVSSAKERSPEELLTLLKTLLPYVDEAFHRVEPEASAPAPVPADGDCPDTAAVLALTGREREVLYWTAQGKGCWETGLIVGISERTVKFHLQNIYRKLNVVNRAQAVAKAARVNLLQLAN